MTWRRGGPGLSSGVFVGGVVSGRKTGESGYLINRIGRPGRQGGLHKGKKRKEEAKAEVWPVRGRRQGQRQEGAKGERLCTLAPGLTEREAASYDDDRLAGAIRGCGREGGREGGGRKGVWV
jgi:hypothetical protein